MNHFPSRDSMTRHVCIPDPAAGLENNTSTRHPAIESTPNMAKNPLEVSENQLEPPRTPLDKKAN